MQFMTKKMFNVDSVFKTNLYAKVIWKRVNMILYFT